MLFKIDSGSHKIECISKTDCVPRTKLECFPVVQNISSLFEKEWNSPKLQYVVLVYIKTIVNEMAEFFLNFDELRRKLPLSVSFLVPGLVKPECTLFILVDHLVN